MVIKNPLGETTSSIGRLMKELDSDSSRKRTNLKDHGNNDMKSKLS